MHDGTGNRSIAELLLENEYKDVKLLPKIHASEKALRARYFGAEYAKLHPTSNPDAIIDGVIIEFKSASRRNMSKRVLEAAQKSNIVLLKIEESISDNSLQQFLKGQWKLSDRSNMQELILYIHGDFYVYKRP